MGFLKALLSWKLWLNILVGAALVWGIWYYIFGWLQDYTQHGASVEIPELSAMNIQEAVKTLDSLGLEYEIDSLKFSEKYKPFEVIDFYPIAGSHVKPGRRVFIKSNPRTYQPVALPDLVDKSKRLAFTQLHTRGFVVGDTIYVEDPAKDAVIRVLYDKEPVEAGTFLPKGATVDLELGRGYKLDMPVPNIVGLTLEDATTKLNEFFFEKGQVFFLNAKIDDNDNNGEVNENNKNNGIENENKIDSLSAKVVFQDPPANDLYDEGLPISLWLSRDDPKNLTDEIDSLQVVFKHKIDSDSVYYKSINNAGKVNIKTLPEDIRNQVQNDENLNRKKKKKPKAIKKQPAKIDTTGIQID